jgi:hypothetical protein
MQCRCSSAGLILGDLGGRVNGLEVSCGLDGDVYRRSLPSRRQPESTDGMRVSRYLCSHLCHMAFDERVGLITLFGRLTPIGGHPARAPVRFRPALVLRRLTFPPRRP